MRGTGATTVAATALLAARAGISVFVTGGIGGVHRGGERSLDISADLPELARTPVAVVCAGAKSVLDIPRTLEVLETAGVPVVAWRQSGVPAFFEADSGVPAPARADTAAEAAAIIAAIENALAEYNVRIDYYPVGPQYLTELIDAAEAKQAAE